MPIRLNLLAEAQAIEELRRRDPVKRAVLAGVVLLICTLVWSGLLVFQKIAAEGSLTTMDGVLNSRTNEYRQILENERRLNDTKMKLAALNRLATNRFLIGNLLSGLQRGTVENVQLVHLALDQKYTVVEGSKAKTNENNIVSPPKAATATEKITLTLDAKDNSQQAGDAVSKFQDALSRSPYFQEMLKTNGFRLKTLGSPQVDPDGKPFVLFTLEARFPEKTR